MDSFLLFWLSLRKYLYNYIYSKTNEREQFVGHITGRTGDRGNRWKRRDDTRVQENNSGTDYVINHGSHRSTLSVRPLLRL